MTGMISAELDYQSDVIAAKAKHYLISTMGRVFEEANTENCTVLSPMLFVKKL